MIVGFEGLDAAGKSSLIAELVSRDPDLFVVVRDVGYDELMMEKSRLQQLGIDLDVEDTIQFLYGAILACTDTRLSSLVERGKVPLLDRYVDTFVVYADVFNPQYRLGLEFHLWMANAIQSKLESQPDLLFYVPVTYDAYKARMTKRGTRAALEAETRESFLKLQRGYEQQFRRYAFKSNVLHTVPLDLSPSERADWCLDIIKERQSNATSG